MYVRKGSCQMNPLLVCIADTQTSNIKYGEGRVMKCHRSIARSRACRESWKHERRISNPVGVVGRGKLPASAVADTCGAINTTTLGV